MFEFKDSGDNRVTVRSMRTMQTLIGNGTVTSATPFKRASEPHFIPAGRHGAVSEAIMKRNSPAVTSTQVGAEIERRTAALRAAAVAMQGVIGFLTARKAEGGTVGLRLDPPGSLGDNRVCGVLVCACLRPEQLPRTEEYEVTVEPSGNIFLSYPVTEPGEWSESTWSDAYSDAQLVRLITEAEVREELRISEVCPSFVI